MASNSQVHSGTLNKGEAARVLNIFSGPFFLSTPPFIRRTKVVELEHALVRAVEENDDYFRRLVSKAIAKGAIDKISAPAAKELIRAVVQSDTKTSDESIEELGRAGVVAKLIEGRQMSPLISRLRNLATVEAYCAIGSLLEYGAIDTYKSEKQINGLVTFILQVCETDLPEADKALEKILNKKVIDRLSRLPFPPNLRSLLEDFLDYGTENGYKAFDIAVDAGALDGLALTGEAGRMVRLLSQNSDPRALVSLQNFFNRGAVLFYHQPLARCAPDDGPEHKLSDLLLSLIDCGLEEADGAVGAALATEDGVGGAFLTGEEWETVLLALKATGRQSAFDAIRGGARNARNKISDAAKTELLEVVEGTARPSAPTQPGPNTPRGGRVPYTADEQFGL